MGVDNIKKDLRKNKLKRMKVNQDFAKYQGFLLTFGICYVYILMY